MFLALPFQVKGQYSFVMYVLLVGLESLQCILYQTGSSHLHHRIAVRSGAEIGLLRLRLSVSHSASLGIARTHVPHTEGISMGGFLFNAVPCPI